MKKLQTFGLLFSLLVGLVFNFTPVLAQSGEAQVVHHRTYTVEVGAEYAPMGIDVEQFFPNKLTIHVGDSVLWRLRTNEIHTVTFLAGEAMPDFVIPVQGQASPVQLNPQAVLPAGPADGQYDGKTFVNSGLMGKAPGQVQTFRLTFTQAGVYKYVCLVHGMMMSGEVDVVSAKTSIASPDAVSRQAGSQMTQLLQNASPSIKQVDDKLPAPVHNADGTTTYHVFMGAMVGSYDLMRFFPNSLHVHPGDTVVWSFGPDNDAPHTVTFLNGTAEPPLVTPLNQTVGLPIFLLNPTVVLPANAGSDLTTKGLYNSGFLVPAVPGQPAGPQTFSIKIGQGVSRTIPYVCLLHDSSGMVGELIVTPR